MFDLCPDLAVKRDRLLAMLRGYGSCGVAYSGGVDSAVLAQAARLALGDDAVAVTAVSPSLAAGELDAARDLAVRIGIRHEVIHTAELDNPLYTQNAPDRCYHCKTELYTRLAGLAGRLGVAVIVNGANVDDVGDHRPGMTAAAEQSVRSPLLQCGLTKVEVRDLARHWQLPVWDKPATPCLSSRIAYGESVTAERLRRIDLAEQALCDECLGAVRVRYHQGDVARIEVPVEAIERLCRPAVRLRLVERLKSLGFKYVTLDLEGFRSGSQNEVLTVELAPLGEWGRLPG